MPCPYKEGSVMCWFCWYWIEAEEKCVFNEGDAEREFLFIDEFKDTDPEIYKERMKWLRDLGLMHLYRAIKARRVKEQRTLSDFGVVVMSHVENYSDKRGTL